MGCLSRDSLWRAREGTTVSQSCVIQFQKGSVIARVTLSRRWVTLIRIPPSPS
jgi:hypothetical protein